MIYFVCSSFIDHITLAITLSNIAQLFAHNFHPYGVECGQLIIAGHCLLGDWVDDAIAHLFKVDVDIEGGFITDA